MQPPSQSSNQPNDGNKDPRSSRGQNRRYILQNRWEVLSLLGQGGMGTVYMSRDLRLANRQCVVKKLRDDFFRQEDKEKALLFFQREAFVLSRLQHSNIVHILDYFEESGDYFLVMEYVEGENLQQLIHRGDPFAEHQVVAWASQIAEVLNYLHSHEPPVIYRDLKPSNIMIDNLGRVKLVDFGIARPYAEDADNTHVVSAGYSPPEQYWGAADPRSDIYALGATMHFLLTGFEPLALQTSSPKKLNPKISDKVDHLVQRATSQDIWLRYQTAAEMKEELEHCVNPALAKNARISNLVVSLVALTIAGLSILAYVHFLDITRGRDEEKGKRQRLEQKLKEAYTQGINKDKELELLRELSSSDKQTTEERKFEAQPKEVKSAALPVNAQAANLSLGAVAMTKAFQERDEALLTDPDGLPSSSSFPSENQLPSFGSSAEPGQTSEQP